MTGFYILLLFWMLLTFRIFAVAAVSFKLTLMDIEAPPLIEIINPVKQIKFLNFTEKNLLNSITFLHVLTPLIHKYFMYVRHSIFSTSSIIHFVSTHKGLV